MAKCAEPNCYGKSEKLINCCAPFCDLQFHLSCANLKGIKKSEINNLYFLCNKCNEFVTYSNSALQNKLDAFQNEIKTLLSPINCKLEKIESDLKSSILAISDRVDKLEQNNLDNQINLSNTVKTIKSIETKIDAEVADLKNKISHLNEKLTHFNSNQCIVDDSKTLIKNNEMIKYKVKICGIPEAPSDLKHGERQEYEKSSINKIFEFIQLNNITLTDSFRLGKFNKDNKRPRSIIATVSSVWDRNKILQNAFLLKDYSPSTFISPALSQADRILEKKILKKRFELINSGVDKKELKIRNLKLYKGKEEVLLSDE